MRFLPGAEEYAQAGAIPAGLVNNREFVESARLSLKGLEPGHYHLALPLNRLAHVLGEGGCRHQ